MSQIQQEPGGAGLAPCSKQGNPRSQEVGSTTSSLLQLDQDAAAAAPHDEWCPTVLCVLKSLTQERERIWLPGLGHLSAPRSRGQEAFSDSMEADSHLKIYHPSNTTWNERGQFSQRKSAYHSEGRIYPCSWPKEKKKEKESYKQQHVCVFVFHLRRLSRSNDIIKKTISAHKRPHQPKSTISGTLSLP